ncbi:MAG TPA: hypothetical protein VF881_03655 [Polyangiaceae bacterium]
MLTTKFFIGAMVVIWAMVACGGDESSRAGTQPPDAASGAGGSGGSGGGGGAGGKGEASDGSFDAPARVEAGSDSDVATPCTSCDDCSKIIPRIGQSETYPCVGSFTCTVPAGCNQCGQCCAHGWQCSEGKFHYLGFSDGCAQPCGM